jgi:hypothetical protein
MLSYSFLLMLFFGKYNVLAGEIYDAVTKEPLPMVNVIIVGTELGTVTDDKGYYSIILADSISEFQVRYSMIGYKQVIRSVKFEGKEYLEANISMRMEPLKAQGILVSAKKKRFRSTASITPPSISQSDLNLLPSFVEGDLMRTIEALPGVTKSSDFFTAISVRGGGPDQNRVLIDDVPLLNPFHLFGLLSAFNSNAIKNAELYSSGVPIEHDASLSSVLDIKTKGVDKEIEGLSGDVSLSILSGGLTLGSKIPSINSNFLLSVRRTYADKLLSLFNYELPYYFYDGYLHWGTDIKDWSLVISGYLGKDFLDIRDDDDKSIKIIAFDWGNKVGTLNLFHSDKEGDLLHIFAGLSNHDFYLRVLDTIFITNGNISVWTSGAEYTKKIKEHEITVGLNDDYCPFGYNVNFNMGFEYSYQDIWSNRASVYIEDKVGLLENLLFSGGVAFTHYYSESEEFNLTNSDFLQAYRLSAKYFFDDLRAVTFSFGNFHQYIVPGGSVIRGITGGVDIPVYYWVPLGGEYDPEEAYHFNLGCEGWLNEQLYFSLEGYYRRYSHLLDMRDYNDPSINISTERQYYETMLKRGSGNAYGFDFLLKKEIGNLRGWLSYSFLKTDVTFEEETYPTDWDRSHNFHLTLLSLLGKRYEAGIQFGFCTGNPYTTSLARFRNRMEILPYGDDEITWRELEGERNEVRYPPYLRLDASLSRSFYFGNNELDLKLSLYNVLNSKNVFMYYYDYGPEPPVKEPFYMLPFIPSIEFIYRF